MTRRPLALLVSFVLCGAGPAAADNVDNAIKKVQKDKKAAERAFWAKWLGGNADPRAVAALAQALQDKDVEVRETAASGLWKTGDKAKAAEPALRKALDDLDAAVVVRAAGALEVMDVDPKELAEPRRRALSKAGPKDSHTAFLAARGLIGIDPPATVLPGLFPYLAAMSAELQKPGGWSNYNDDVQAAAKALERVAKTKDRSAIPLLQAELERSPASAPSLLAALGAFKPAPDKFAQTLVQQMRARDTRTREAALEQCRELTGDADVAVWAPEAASALRDPESGVRSDAMWAARQAGGRAAAATPELVRLLKQANTPAERAHAAETLGYVGDASQSVPQKVKTDVAEQAKAALVAAAAEKDDTLADNALSAYNKLLLPSSEVVGVLIQAAESGASLRARERALQMLRNRQGQAKPVLERVRALAQSPDKRVAEDAKHAVDAIVSGGPGTPNPLAAPRASAGKAAPAPSAEAEARGHAKLRELKIAFEEGQFYRSLDEAKPDVVRAFLDAGMSPSHKFSSDARSPLMILFFGNACTAGRPTPEPVLATAKMLLADGADVNQADDNANTPLMFAASSCDRSAIRLLLAAGAKTPARNKGGLSAIGMAMGIPMNYSATEELLAAGARLEAEYVQGYLDAHKADPKAVALVKKAAAR